MKASAVLSLIALAGFTIAAPAAGSNDIVNKRGGWDDKPAGVAVGAAAEAYVPVKEEKPQEHWHEPAHKEPFKSDEYAKDAGKKYGKEGGAKGKEEYKSVQDNESASFSKSHGETTDRKEGENWGKEGGQEYEKEKGKSSEH
ncbi:hypothetical protein AbraIFM66950_003342 [Aspergillus brasiliensis]|nr:hypothetical protein AbraIFM66950_003342 [Aspergillus brasiliensis]